MIDCPRVGKLFGGCKFSPRYDTVGGADPFIEFINPSVGQYRARPARKTYVCDVCERCGKMLFKRKPVVS